MSRLFKAILLDFDGVLVPSNDIKTEAFKKVFSDYPAHLERMMRYHHDHISVSRQEKFQYFIRNCIGKSEDPVLLGQLMDLFSKEVSGRIASCPPVEGSLDFLEEFSKTIPLYLASVTPAVELKKVVEERSLKKYFKEVYGYPPISKKEAIVRVKQKEKCNSEDLVLIGDSEGDWKAAQDAKIEFIGFDSGLPLPSNIRKFPDWKALAGYLRPKV